MKRSCRWLLKNIKFFLLIKLKFLCILSFRLEAFIFRVKVFVFNDSYFFFIKIKIERSMCIFIVFLNSK